MEKIYHTLTAEETIENLSSNTGGLSEKEAKNRLSRYGLNKLPEKKPEGFFLIFLRQFQSPLIYILLLAMIIVFATGENADGLVILFVIVFNSIVGAVQEGRAKNTMLALKKFIQTNATVLRDGKEIIIADEEVVPGDILIIQEGEKIPADARVIRSNSFRVDESTLTGESIYKYKITSAIQNINTPIADQSNIIFRGTGAIGGNGRAVVIATGSNTYIGRITEKIAEIESEIPLKKEVARLSKIIMAVVFAIVLMLSVLGSLYNFDWREIFKTAVAISISVIPEGLPIVMTLVLATGVRRMSRKNVLVKKLQAVEALGQAKVIAVDKTGTLTKNELSVEKVFVNGRFFEISGLGYEPKGDVYLKGKAVNASNYKELLLMGKISEFCCNARLAFSESLSKWQVFGDPTEAAMLVFSEKLGFRREISENESPRIAEIPFDYKNKIHATLNQEEKINFLTIVGAPEKVLELCDKIEIGIKSHVLDDEKREELEKIFASMSRKGLRIIALAMTKVSEKNIDVDNLSPLVFVGFLGMKDVLREDARNAVLRTRLAGIKVVMITGDHRITAEAVAREAGIIYSSNSSRVITGKEIEKASIKELAEILPEVSIFARVNPEHKMKIIEAYKERGEIIAMTGDGVNDALSLVAADLGVAMGKSGTEVAKEASDIVLLDDNFGNIVFGVEEGRNIYKTIKKVILYLFSTSIGEVLTIIVAIFIGYPLPILAVQIVWLNLITDGFLDVALAMEPKEDGLLKENSLGNKRRLVDKLMIKRMFLMALPMMLGTLALFGSYFKEDLTKAWTISLTLLAIFQWFNAWNCRSEFQSIFRMKFFSNRYLILATLIVITLQILAIYAPALQKILHTVPLKLSDWLILIPVGFSIILVEEARKLIHRKFSKYIL